MTSGTLTVLFTDLVGSTELMASLGDSAFDELRGEHFARLRDALAAHGGVEVKNTGDGVMATFASTVEAVACAIAMQQAAERQEIAIRVGLSVGEVSLEDGDAFGTPVVEAARLVAAARPGQILATSILRLLAGSRAGASFTDLEAMDLKGLPAPVPVCEVAWEPLPRSPVPLPALLTDIGRIFVGREAELERLRQLWKEAAAGERRVALLAGEPGVGKTRLAAELAAVAHDEGAVVLAGRCDEDLGVPYQPFVEALRHFADHSSPDDLRSRLGRHGGELARLVPELTDRVADLPPPLESDPETERYRLFDAVAGWLGAASADEPVLLVLDDLQWGAKPTLLLLRHVVRSPDARRVLVLGTYRDTELAHDHPLVEVLADLRRQGGVERLSLVGLDQLGVAAHMEEAAGHHLDDDDLPLARAIHQETEGNPFFVREVLRHLAETGAIERHEGRWGSRLPLEELGIPEGVREVVGRRLSRLSEEANQALRLAAVVGAEFELPVMQLAGHLGEESLLSALEEATETGLVIEGATATRYRFAHALVRDTLYQELSAPRRVALHRRVAEAIEGVHAAGLDDHLPALAHHWARASAPAADTVRAVDYAARAGDRALAQLAHDEAAAYYRQALEILQAADGPADEPRRLDLLISLGEAQRRAGDPAYRQTLLAAARLAREQGDHPQLARAALANTRGLLMSAALTLDRDRIDILEEAISQPDALDEATRARLLAILAVELVFSRDYDKRVSLSDEALRIARRHGDTATLAHVLVARVPTIWGPGGGEERLVTTAELLTVAERLGDPLTLFRAHYLRYRITMEAGDVEEMDRHLGRAQALAADLGQPTLRWMVGWLRAGRLLLAGRIEETERLVRETLEVGQATGQPDAGLFFAIQQFWVRFEQGRLAELGEGLISAVQANYRGVPGISAMAAQFCCEVGRDEEARKILEDVAASRFADLPIDHSWLPTVMLFASVAAHLGDVERSATLHALLAPYADESSVAGGVWVGPGNYHLGLLATTLGRCDEAEGRFAAASATQERIGAPTWLARTRLEWARMLFTRRRPGDAERARELLHQALATARELGLAGVERRAVELLEQ